MSKKIILISDLHLCPNELKIAAIFLQFLKNQCDSTCDALYILGDFFETWIGDDDTSAFVSDIKSALKKVTSAGVPIYFLHGNRDFLIGKKFLAETGCELIAEETRVSFYGTPVLLMHGDTLCTLDINYLKLRKRLRSPLLQKLFLQLPLSLRQRIANKMRAHSKLHTKKMSEEKMDVVQTDVLQKIKQHQVDYLIHGHTHRLAIHHFALDEKDYTRIVLGAWHEKGNALVWKASGDKELVHFDLVSSVE